MAIDPGTALIITQSISALTRVLASMMAVNNVPVEQVAGELKLEVEKAKKNKMEHLPTPDELREMQNEGNDSDG